MEVKPGWMLWSSRWMLEIRRDQMEKSILESKLADYVNFKIEETSGKFVVRFRNGNDFEKFYEENSNFVRSAYQNHIQMSYLPKTIGTDKIRTNLEKLATVIMVEKLYGQTTCIVELATEDDVKKVLDFFYEKVVFYFGMSEMPTMATRIEHPGFLEKTDESVNFEPIEVQDFAEIEFGKRKKTLFFEMIKEHEENKKNLVETYKSRLGLIEQEEETRKTIQVQFQNGSKIIEGVMEKLKDEAISKQWNRVRKMVEDKVNPKNNGEDGSFEIIPPERSSKKEMRHKWTTNSFHPYNQ